MVGRFGRAISSVDSAVDLEPGGSFATVNWLLDLPLRIVDFWLGDIDTKLSLL